MVRHQVAPQRLQNSLVPSCLETVAWTLFSLAALLVKKLPIWLPVMCSARPPQPAMGLVAASSSASAASAAFSSPEFLCSSMAAHREGVGEMDAGRCKCETGQE